MITHFETLGFRSEGCRAVVENEGGQNEAVIGTVSVIVGQVSTFFGIGVRIRRYTHTMKE
ncbi:MAG: hypothetical protein DRJ61_17655 [Acidobacteria bacterium]|nr:MAG: hypothetical protein DRJ61_17655 [Acidobacteriota bacterium]